MLGYALDGFQIMGPYDASGVLQVGSSIPELATLDECNGKMENDGTYRYYVTPNAPYSVACFKGDAVGSFEDQWTFGTACPLIGTKSVYCNPTVDLDCTLKMDKDCIAVPYEGPYFLFRANPKLDSPRWDLYSTIFGSAFLAISLPAVAHLCVLMREKKEGKVITKVFMDLMIIVTSLSRAFSLLVDPHYTKETLSPFVVGVVYGLPYPALNATVGLMLLVLYEQLATSRSFLTSQLPPPPLMSVSARVSSLLSCSPPGNFGGGGKINFCRTLSRPSLS
jgi:hypothetical protein